MGKRVLIDLSALKDAYCGLGQVALNYGRYFENNYKRSLSKLDITLLVPTKFIGQFGKEVKYISSTNVLNKHYQFLFPKFDVWHSTHQLSRFIPKHKDTKYILTIHDLNYLYEQTGERQRKNHEKVQNKVDRADHIVCISEFAKSDVEKFINLGGKSCQVILNGVETLDQNLAKQPNENVKNPFFFTIGVVQKKKNMHVLLDMMKQMPDKHLYIAGKEIKKEKKNGYAISIRQRIADENIQNITLLGGVSHEEKIWLYKNCEAFLFPSLFEGFGLPIIEAMEFGKPVFSSQETSLKEIGSSYAFFWQNFDPLHMKEVVENNLSKFYDNEELVAQQVKYAKSFSYETHFEQYKSLYEKL